MFQPKLALSALALELAAWTGALRGESSDAALLAYLAGHAVAGALMALLFLRLLPAPLQQPRRPILLLLFGIGFAVPLLGFVGIAAAVVALRSQRAAPRPAAFRAVPLPAIDPHQRPGSGFRQAGLGSFLANSHAPEGTRLRALVALQNVPGRLASPLLRNVLADPCEDIRLLAYGMLDGQEKRLNDLIHQERTRLAEGDDDSRADATQRLADLYWELVYQELAQGDLRTHALQQSLMHTLATLERDSDAAALHLRLGRLRQMLGEAAGAHAAYQRALALGMPRTRITPYLAELEYDARRFAAVRAHMAELGGWASLPRLRPVIRYWSAT